MADIDIKPNAEPDQPCAAKVAQAMLTIDRLSAADLTDEERSEFLACAGRSLRMHKSTSCLASWDLDLAVINSPKLSPKSF
jgi:hypothetical protein